MNVFVYGTLLVPQIWEAVTRTPCPASFPAELRGFSIFRIRNAVYPGIVESTPGATVPGRVFLDVSDASLKRLDSYEDSFYDRRSVSVSVRELGEIPAQAYCIRADDAAALLTSETWSLAHFEENSLDQFWANTFGR